MVDSKYNMNVALGEEMAMVCWECDWLYERYI